MKDGVLLRPFRRRDAAYPSPSSDETLAARVRELEELIEALFRQYIFLRLFDLCVANLGDAKGNAEENPQPFVLGHVNLPNFGLKSVTELDRSFLIEVWKQNQKFVSRLPAKVVSRTDMLPQSAGNLLKHSVSKKMSLSVVDDLEAIDINRQKRENFRPAPLLGQFQESED